MKIIKSIQSQIHALFKRNDLCVRLKPYCALAANLPMNPENQYGYIDIAIACADAFLFEH